MFIKKLFPFFNEDGGAEGTAGVEGASAAGEQTEVDSQKGVEGQAAAEQEKQNNFEKAFAKRLAEAQSKWEQEAAEKYKDYDLYRKAGDYLLKQAGAQNLMTLAEQIELAELQERADQQQVPVEVLRRIQELEQKAAKADAFEQQQKQAQQFQEFRSKLEAYAKEKDVDPDKLHTYMYENGVSNFDVAYKAMKAEELEAKLQEKETDTIKRYLESKKAPIVEGSGSAGLVAQEPPKSWEEARERALARFRSANQAQ